MSFDNSLDRPITRWHQRRVIMFSSDDCFSCLNWILGIVTGHPKLSNTPSNWPCHAVLWQNQENTATYQHKPSQNRLRASRSGSSGVDQKLVCTSAIKSVILRWSTSFGSWKGEGWRPAVLLWCSAVLSSLNKVDDGLCRPAVTSVALGPVSVCGRNLTYVPTTRAVAVLLCLQPVFIDPD